MYFSKYLNNRTLDKISENVNRHLKLKTFIMYISLCNLLDCLNIGNLKNLKYSQFYLFLTINFDKNRFNIYDSNEIRT